jgi:hypothetical protein
MKTAQHSHRTHSHLQANRSLLMLGIAILDCVLLFFIIFLCGLLMTSIR